MDNNLFLLLTARELSGEATERDLEELEKFFDQDNLYKKKYDLLKAHWENKNNIPTDIDKALQKIMLQIRNEEKEKINSFTPPGKK